MTAATPTSATQPPSLPEVGAVLGGAYRLTKIIGTGGMGAVYLARHEAFDEEVAVKVLLPSMANEEARRRFEREARILFKLKSPRVCRVIDVGTEADIPYMVMEYLRGQDLGYRMEAQRRFELETALEITLQLCEAIAEAHVRDVVHRDLKPENVFLQEGDEISLKLLDFGLSKDRSSVSAGGGGEGRGRRLTATKQVFGTPFYMAPEQWIAAGRVGPAADQWAIGAILYEMLAGRPPFYAEAFAAVCTGILHDPTPSVRQVRPDVPPGLDTALAKALEKDPRDRFAHVGALAVALSAFAGPGASRRVERLQRMLDDMAPEEETTLYVPTALPTARGHRASDMHATVPDVRGRAASQHAWDVDGARPIAARAAMALGAGALLAVLIGVLVVNSRSEPRRAARVGLVPVVQVPDDLGPREASGETAANEPPEEADGSAEEADVGTGSDPGATEPASRHPVRIRRPRPKPKPNPSIFDDR